MKQTAHSPNQLTKLLFWALLALILASCGGSSDEVLDEASNDAVSETVEEAEPPIDDANEAVEEVVEEAFEEAEEDAMAEEEAPAIAPTSIGGQSVGQEGAAQGTPFAPRDKRIVQVPTGAAPEATPTPAEVRSEGGAPTLAPPNATPLPTDAPVRSEPTPAPSTPTPIAAVSNSPRPAVTATPTAVVLASALQLSAGVVDDNASFAAYLNYLASYSGPTVEPLPVETRHRIVVVDENGNPVLGASVLLYDNDRGELVQILRTQANGGAWFWPSTLDSDLPTSYDVEVIADGEAVYADSFEPVGDTVQMVTVPSVARDALALDILLLLDTTGSMGDELAELKANILSIAQRTIAAPAQPDLRFGMVTYRDIDEAYLTQVVDFSADFAQFETELDAVTAERGGDYPEDLNSGLQAALNEVSWRDDAIQLIFLVADAPPHLDYGQDAHYAVSALEANKRGIKLYPIASSGLDVQGEYVFRQLAQITGGQFIFLVDDGDTATASGSAETEQSPSNATDFTVDQFTVSTLDEIVYQLIERELAFQAP